MDNKELESRLNQLTGNVMGLQTLLLSVIATSGKRVNIANHFKEEALRTMATLNAESGLPDEVLGNLERWYATTLEMLISDEEL
ncbi:hypothetical protein NH8B_0570 [Pseudogulbenkiania sp. NH8B]|uniref:hypothetical protein n=1 Tax=Pseudogulbenkiania sp. (strain NH8B) TaxID=748280 RepID=UPI000227957A|nr:hypothetical protein [Pseudogulbenkiania sp. NH8B]BAK75405.1 hypothetical protein NH8B_0570 [Pseudogulbenkiania sp. NH8B]